MKIRLRNSGPGCLMGPQLHGRPNTGLGRSIICQSARLRFTALVFTCILRLGLHDDGLDGLFVEEGVIRGGEFVVRWRGGILDDFAAEEPGMD